LQRGSAQRQCSRSRRDLSSSVHKTTAHALVTVISRGRRNRRAGLGRDGAADGRCAGPCARGLHRRPSIARLQRSGGISGDQGSASCRRVRASYTLFSIGNATVSVWFRRREVRVTGSYAVAVAMRTGETDELRRCGRGRIPVVGDPAVSVEISQDRDARRSIPTARRGPGSERQH